MSTCVLNLPVLQDNNLIGIFDGGQTMCDDQQRFPFCQSSDGLLDFFFVLLIGERGCLVQNHDGGIFQNHAGNRNALFFTA